MQAGARAERPVYLKALVKFVQVLQGATGRPNDLDRRRNREDRHIDAHPVLPPRSALCYQLEGKPNLWEALGKWNTDLNPFD